MIGRRTFFAALASVPAARVLGETGAVVARPPARPLPDARRLVGASGLAGGVGFAWVDRRTGALLEGGRSLAPMPPASTMKALTALYALARLGPKHRFRTRVIRAGDMLVLAGGGDPVLASDDLASLAADLVASGEAPPARFGVWGGALPQLAEIAPEQADHLAYNPALSGMILNFNRVHMGWRRANGAIEMSVEARAARNSPRAYTITVAPGEQRELFSYRSGDGRESWTVARSALNGSGSRWLPVRKPELYAGDVFQTLCRAKGLVLPAPEAIDALPVGVEVAGLDSPPLTVLLRDMLLYSTNLTAEVLGLAASGAVDPAASAAAMQAWLQDQGLGQGFLLADHSGLSAASRLNAQGLARALAVATGAVELAGLLRDNPLDEDPGALAGRNYRVSAKTGTLNFVSNLAGHLDASGGAETSFAILCADMPRHAASSGQEMPAGVQTWTREARGLQSRLLAGWAARGLENPVPDLGR